MKGYLSVADTIPDINMMDYKYAIISQPVRDILFELPVVTKDRTLSKWRRR